MHSLFNRFYVRSVLSDTQLSSNFLLIVRISCIIKLASKVFAKGPGLKSNGASSATVHADSAAVAAGGGSERRAVGGKRVECSGNLVTLWNDGNNLPTSLDMRGSKTIGLQLPPNSVIRIPS